MMAGGTSSQFYEARETGRQRTFDAARGIFSEGKPDIYSLGSSFIGRLWMWYDILTYYYVQIG